MPVSTRLLRYMLSAMIGRPPKPPKESPMTRLCGSVLNPMPKNACHGSAPRKPSSACQDSRRPESQISGEENRLPAVSHSRSKYDSTKEGNRAHADTSPPAAMAGKAVIQRPMRIFPRSRNSSVAKPANRLSNDDREKEKSRAAERTTPPANSQRRRRTRRPTEGRSHAKAANSRKKAHRLPNMPAS